MKQVAEFHGRATDCLSMAARAESEIIRIQLEDLAKHWAELAQSRENLIKSQLNQNDLDPPTIRAGKGANAKRMANSSGA